MLNVYLQVKWVDIYSHDMFETRMLVKLIQWSLQNKAVFCIIKQLNLSQSKFDII